jgi:hypothetical protein
VGARLRTVGARTRVRIREQPSDDGHANLQASLVTMSRPPLGPNVSIQQPSCDKEPHPPLNTAGSMEEEEEEEGEEEENRGEEEENRGEEEENRGGEEENSGEEEENEVQERE